jgi:molybdate transport system ATP-binding protein
MGAIECRFRLDWPNFTLDVDLAFPPRGVTALFGHSGSGKTTLLRCIAGLERAPRGFLAINGEVWQDDHTWRPPFRRPIGYVFQEASLFTHLTVLGNLRYGVTRSSDRQPFSLDHAIDLLGIRPILDRHTDRLSGGERQRVAIARALAVNPRLLLMDEPLASLDVKRKQEILPYLERLRDEMEIPIVYVSHSPDEVARLADYLVAMEGGHVLAKGPLVETLARLDLRVRLGDDIGTILYASVAAIDDTWKLARVDFPGGSLWTPDHGYAVGRSVRVRILARDVSLARELSFESSIQNALRGCVDAIGDDEHPASTLVRVRVGESFVVARLTKRAASALNVAAGQDVWAQVKAVALLD